MNEHEGPTSSQAGLPEAIAKASLVMERKDKLEELDHSFDIEFWQRQGTAAIFSAAWELVETYHRQLGPDPNVLRFQRTTENFQRLPG